MKYEPLVKVVETRINFHDIDLYSNLLMIEYIDGRNKDSEFWLISKESYLSTPDLPKYRDPDYWNRGRSKFQKNLIPLESTQVHLVSQEFLDDPKRFWDLEKFREMNDHEKRSQIPGYVPVYLNIYDHSVYDINMMPMRLPGILSAKVSDFDIEALNEHMQKHPDFISMEKNSFRFSDYEMLYTIKTENLPIPKNIYVTHGIINDNFMHQFGKYATDYFGILKFKRERRYDYDEDD